MHNSQRVTVTLFHFTVTLKLLEKIKSFLKNTVYLNFRLWWQRVCR